MLDNILTYLKECLLNTFKFEAINAFQLRLNGFLYTMYARFHLYISFYSFIYLSFFVNQKMTPHM